MSAKLHSISWLLLGTALAAAETPAPSRVVVLDNENLLEGEVTRVEGGYQIRRGDGGEVTMPAGRVLAVVADRKAAFSLVAGRANQGDADERLRLARWCLTNDLPNLALKEARAAARMRPGFAGAEQLVRALEAGAGRDSAEPRSPVGPARADTPAKDEVADVPVVEYNRESFGMFAAKINPILMNLCASCHASEDVKVFRLTRTGGRSGVAKNLMAAVAQVNAKDPAASPLLTKALTAHGSATTAPFKVRTHPAYQNLELWARFARAPEGTPVPELPVRAGEPGKLPEFGADLPDGPAGRDGKAKSPAADPFDPAIFNGAPKKK